MEITQYLISRGAKARIQNRDGLSPLDMAIRERQTGPIETLLAAGADVNTANKNYGDTPLHRAVQLGEVDAVRLLLAAGAKVNARNNASQTPMAVAGGSSDAASQIRKLLEEHGGRLSP